MEIIETTPVEYIASIEDDKVRNAMSLLHTTIAEAMPDRATVVWHGTFWGGTEQTIIGYGHITQPRPKGPDVDWFLAGLARQKRNYSIYLNAVRDQQYLAHHYADRLGKVKLGAASIGFTKPENIDLVVLAELLSDADRSTPPDP
jgi:hypothetical protein